MRRGEEGMDGEQIAPLIELVVQAEHAAKIPRASPLLGGDSGQAT